MDGNRPLFAAIARLRRMSTFVALLDAGCDVNSRSHGLTPLHVACMVNTSSYVRQLLRCPDIDVNARTETGDRTTALILACITRCPKTIRALMERPELDFSARDYWGDSALDVARRIGDPEILVALLKKVPSKKLRWVDVRVVSRKLTFVD